MNPLVLVVDDDALIHKLVGARLRAEDVVMKYAFNAESALAIAKESPPDCVLLDLDLDGRSGIELISLLKGDAKLKSAQIIMLAGSDDVRVKAEAFDAGATDYITKPFDAIELRARVRSALRTKHYLDLLETKANRDGLTGLWNRRYLDERLVQELSRATRNGLPLSVAIIDVDRFKTLNDTFGHPVGDQVLRLVVDAVMGECRRSDILCRYGGDEFVMLLPDTSASNARAFLEKARHAVQQIKIETLSDLHVSISVGVSSSDEVNLDDLTVESLLAAADANLYEAKRAGRTQG